MNPGRSEWRWAAGRRAALILLTAAANPAAAAPGGPATPFPTHASPGAGPKTGAVDEASALANLDELRARHDQQRRRRYAIESAAERRRIAALAYDAFFKSGGGTKRDGVSLASVILRYEEIVRLDPGVIRDWARLRRLYGLAGRPADALEAQRREAALETPRPAEDDRP